ncbi:MAG TPA: hypothetical protein VMH20_06525 [Verrucomicrobiae bacterium]|nr:hypothetical protein [Verrucomicrobiae bacterium]
MKGKLWFWAVCMAGMVALTAGIAATAEDPIPSCLTGVIHDYSPISGGTTAWEVRGPWTLKLNEENRTATFSAALTMEQSVVGQTPTNVTAVALTQHTHHITMKNASVSYDPTNCPAAPSGTPAYAAQIEVSGTASVYANGSVAPFGEFSHLQVCIAGGPNAPNVPFSNITLVFEKPAAGHFGTQAIHGVVSKTERNDD